MRVKREEKEKCEIGDQSPHDAVCSYIDEPPCGESRCSESERHERAGSEASECDDERKQIERKRHYPQERQGRDDLRYFCRRRKKQERGEHGIGNPQEFVREPDMHLFFWSWTRAASEEQVHIRLSHKLLWIAYAMLPAFLLLATTTEITQVIAPLPLLWIVPLSLYLLTFIIAFAGFRAGSLVPLALGASAFAAWWFIDVTAYGVTWRLVADLTLLFFLSLPAHSHLYRLRPAAERSPLFYLLISFGGML